MQNITPSKINIVNQVYNDVKTQNITVNTIVFNELVNVLERGGSSIEQCMQYIEAHGIPEEMRILFSFRSS
jgi:hypothetical protein